MKNFLKIIAILAIIGIVIVTALLVLDVIDTAETKDILLKTMLISVLLHSAGLVFLFGKNKGIIWLKNQIKLSLSSK